MNSMMNIVYMIVIILLILLDIIIASIKISNHTNGKSAWAYSTEIDIRCFSNDSFIKLSNGENKQIGYLNIGDEIMTIDKSNIVFTEMIMMLDQHKSKEALFYKLITDCGHYISLTKFHLIPIISLNGNKKYLAAKDVQIGDLLFVLFNNKLIYSPVRNITIEIKKGFYAPLTMKGTLLVNHILTSCFAHTNNHHLAQFYMFPFRYYYKLTRFFYLNDPFYIHKLEGFNWIITIMFYFARYFRPETFIL